jgi:hypothetical protein
LTAYTDNFGIFFLEVAIAVSESFCLFDASWSFIAGIEEKHHILFSEKT